MDGGQFIVVLLAGVSGLVLIKYAATWFVKLLEKRPALETTAYLIVAWVGVKLTVITLAHKDIGILDHAFSPQYCLDSNLLWSIGRDCGHRLVFIR